MKDKEKVKEFLVFTEKIKEDHEAFMKIAEICNKALGRELRKR